MGKHVDRFVENAQGSKAGKVDVSKLATKKELANLNKKIDEIAEKVETVFTDLVNKITGLKESDK